MVFSWDFYSIEVIKKVRKLLYQRGGELNDDKICVVRNYRRLVAKGVVVKKKLQVNRTYRKRIG